MSNGESMAKAMAELAQSIHATPNNRRRLKSGTFWARLGCKRRTPERIEEARGLLEHHRVSVSLRARRSMGELRDVTFGGEDRDDWIILTHEELAPMQNEKSDDIVEPATGTTPSDEWFAQINQLRFGSESDVVLKFVVPLFEKLGYEEPDTTTNFTVVMRFGREKLKDKKADVVLFQRDDHINDVHKPENNLILAEAKILGEPINGDVVAQARSYAMFLSPVYYFITNGNAVEIWLYQMTVATDVRVMAFKRAELKQVWPELFRRFCKARVMEVKGKRQGIIVQLQKL